MRNVSAWLDERREYGIFFLRLIIGFHLIHGTQDNILSWKQMLEFRDFLDAQGVPAPLVGALLSAWGQFICGILFIFGAATRFAAAVMVFNFICAMLIAHRTGGYQPAALALIMLFSSLALLVHGPGRPSVDEWRGRASARAQGAGLGAQ